MELQNMGNCPYDKERKRVKKSAHIMFQATVEIKTGVGGLLTPESVQTFQLSPPTM